MLRCLGASPSLLIFFGKGIVDTELSDVLDSGLKTSVSWVHAVSDENGKTFQVGRDYSTETGNLSIDVLNMWSGCPAWFEVGVTIIHACSRYGTSTKHRRFENPLLSGEVD